MANNYNNNNNPPPSRGPGLQLNFGNAFPAQPNYAAEQGRAFPTTPSTFPQPFPNAAGQQEVWGTQPPSSGISSQGYFYNNPSFQQQQQQQNSLASPNSAGGYRSPGGFADVNGGLAHQFQHQNLGGGTPRTGSPYQRQASPANGSRPRTAGQTAGQQQYGNGYLSAPMPGQQLQQGPSIYDDELPTKNPEKFSTSITERVKVQKMLTQEFFKENVERARARNERLVPSFCIERVCVC